MRNESFIQTSSFLRKLTGIIIFVAIAFLFQFIGVFASSSRYLESLTQVNTANKLFELTTITTESLKDTTLTLEKIHRLEDIRGLEKVFFAGFEEAKGNFDEAFRLSTTLPSPSINEQLLECQKTILNYRESAREVFKYAIAEGKEARPARLKNLLLIPAQYNLELNENLRKTQILLQENANRSFERAYQGRLVPLGVAVFLSFFCFLVVIVVGLSMTRKVKRSVGNLISATEQVSGGNLQYWAPILEKDEIGKLTFAFNAMVRKLARGQDRITRIQTLTEAFSEAPDPEQVAEVIMKEGLVALGANAGMVLRLNEDETSLNLLKQEGFPEEILAGRTSFSMENVNPATAAVRSRQPLWIENLDQLEAEFPSVMLELLNDFTRSMTAIPLRVGNRLLGVLIFNFRNEVRFSDDDKSFCLAIARQCAQALNRAQLFEEVQTSFEAASRAVNIRDEFLSIASHELRTPLTPLKMQMQILNRAIHKGTIQEMGQEKILKMVNTAEDQVNRLTRLIDELLDVTRISSGKITLQKEVVSISDLVQEVVERFKSELQSHGNFPELHLASGITAEVDRFRIEQVVANLITNTMRYAPGKPIEISTAKVGPQKISITVKDYGMGISTEDQKRIFSRFERAVPSANFGGLGLGLYIAKQIVVQHHGEIEVESVLGEGAKFTVTLPVKS